MSFLSDMDYSRLLEQHIQAVNDTVVRDHIRAKFRTWSRQYHAARVTERMAELLTSETSRPQALWLRCEADLHGLHLLARRHRFDARLFRAFLVEDALWDSLQPEWFSPFPVHRAHEWRDAENTVVFTFSDARPFRDNGRDRGNDYLERFIDPSRLSSLAALRRQTDHPLVLYVDYRKVKTLEAIGGAASGRYTTVGLVPDSQVASGGYDHVIREPHLYLWPLVIKTVDPDVVHVNVGWSLQGLPFMPFVPDAQKTIVDFYDVIELMPNAANNDVEECTLVQASDRYLWKEFDHFVHRCFDPITADLKQKSGKDDIVSLIEYVKEPMYSHVRDGAEDLRIAYAGIIIQDAAETDSIYYRRFMAMVEFFARESLHLHIYPSPYLYGFGEPKAVQELIRAHDLTNVHACAPLEEDELVKAISMCDYGMSPPADREYHLRSHSLPHKIIAYLRAGLPILVPEDLPHLAALVNEYGIGVVYGPNDAGRMQEILRRQDLRVLKENVAEFRSRWDISKAAEKMTSMYRRVLTGRVEKGRTVAPIQSSSPDSSVLLRGPSGRSDDHALPRKARRLRRPPRAARRSEQDVPVPGHDNGSQGYLLEDRLVRIAQDSVRFGGSWQGRPRNGLPTAWDMETIRFFYDQLAQYQSPGVLDIGANTGSFCLLAAFHQGMHCHAFEPVPHIYDILSANIALNKVENRVKAHRLALTSQNGTSVLKYPQSGRASGMSCLGNPTRFDEWIEFEVECRTLDTIAEQHGGLQVDFMKIDTEGCEWFVLQGAKKLIQEQMPSILLEYYEPNTRQFGYDPVEILKLLRALGYTQCERVSREDIYCPRPTKTICGVPGNDAIGRKGAAVPPQPDSREFQNWLDLHAARSNRLYYRDQSAQTMSSLAALARQFKPTVIVELGTLGGLSLRTWIASTSQTRIHAVDLSFQTLRETLEFLPADLSRVTLLEQDILTIDFARLWSPQDRVIFFVDAHDLPNVPIMKHVLDTALPHLPDGSQVVVDDLWFSEERLTQDNARSFLENRVCQEIDELQCFHGHYAPYHQGGSFLGFAEVIPLLEFVNRHGITLVHNRAGKHVFFVWKKAYLSQDRETSDGSGRSGGDDGSVLHNPLESVPVSDRHVGMIREIAARYQQRDVRGAAESLANALAQDPHDQGLSYGLAVCLARGGMLSQARDVLARNLNHSSHPRYRRLFDDLVRRVGSPQMKSSSAPPRSSDACGLTIFAMPKAFTGHTAIIQKNAIRSWTRLSPAPEIILFGDEPGIREMADEVGATHICDISRNEYGTPLVDKLFEAAQERASHEVLAYVNADMILLDDFVEAVQTVQGQFPNSLLIGQRWDLPVLDEIDFGSIQWRESLQRQLQDRAMLHAECGLDYFVFRKGLWPQIPPFAIGRTAWDNWLVMDPHKRHAPVVDGTAFITAVHQDHDYGHVAGGRHEAWNGMEAAGNRSLAGPADHSGLTTGATWLLREDGTLIQSGPRQPQYMTAAYRDRRSNWLLRQARELIAAGARELAACKCEEMLACLDGWLELKRLGCMPSESMSYTDIAGRYFAGHTLLAQCYMQMGRYEQVAATYTRLLQNSGVQIPPAQRDAIVQVRDRLVCRLETKPSVVPSTVSERRSVDSAAVQSEDSEASSALCPSSRAVNGAAAGHRPTGEGFRSAQRNGSLCIRPGRAGAHAPATGGPQPR